MLTTAQAAGARKTREKRWGNQAGKKRKAQSRQSLPHDREAEESLIGIILLYSKEREKNNFHPLPIIFEAGLEPCDFYYSQNREIFQAAVELYEMRRPIDPLSILNHLKKKGKEVEGSLFSKLIELANSIPYADAETTFHYAQIVKEASKRRQLVARGFEVFKAAQDSTLPIIQPYQLKKSQKEFKQLKK